MKTAAKIALAKAAYTVVHGCRSVVGLHDKCVVTRGNIRFDLDLAQGIDFAIFLLGRFEPRTAKALARLIQPGFTVLDIGANIGAHTLFMASTVGNAGAVYAFEPTTFAYNKLIRNLSLNPDLARLVRPHNVFLGAPGQSAAPDDLYSSWPLAGQPKELHYGHLGERQQATKSVRALDEILDQEKVAKVDLIKIDVDGFECDVLAGAQKMLARDKPVFVMELSPYQLDESGGSIEALLDALLPHGYKLYDEVFGTPLPNSAQALRKMLPSGATCNAIARA